MIELPSFGFKDLHFAMIIKLLVLVVYSGLLLTRAQDDAAAAPPAPATDADVGNASVSSMLPDVTSDKETICQAIKTPDAEMKVDIDGPMDYDDLLRLTVWTSKYNLRGGSKTFEFPPEVNWKRDVLTRLTTMFTASCPSIFVPKGFIAIAKELFMIYMNSVNGSVDHSSMWQPFMAIYDQCLAQTTPFEVESAAFQARKVKVDVKGGGTEFVNILPPSELADQVSDLDIIVDTIWWMFSFSFGNCFWIKEEPTLWATRYKRLFYLDFLNPVRDRWLHAGESTEFGVIFGDFQLDQILNNIRFCVTSAYVKNGIADRQLVRSIILKDTDLGIGERLNRKTGAPLYE